MASKKPIILDRTRIEQYSNCPYQAYLTTLLDALIAQAANKEVFWWEAERVKDAPAALIDSMGKRASLSATGQLLEIGQEIHKLIDWAFQECENDLERVPDWFVRNLPRIRPDIQPMAIKAARHVADIISDYHVNLIGLEKQVSFVLIPETAYPPAVIVTMRFDMLGSGLKSIHVGDWKTGFKRRTNTETRDSFQAQFGAWLLWQQEVYHEIKTIHWWYYETMWGTKSYARFDRDAEHPRLPHLTTQLAIQGRVQSAVKMFMDNSQECWPLPIKCCWCNVISYCKHAQADAKELADNPAYFIDQLVVLDALLKKRKATATAWVKTKGTIEGTDVIFTRTAPSEKFSASIQDKRPTGPTETGDPALDSHFT